MYSASRSVGKSRLTYSDSSFRPRANSMTNPNRDSYVSYSRRSSSEERKSGNGSIRRFSGIRNSFGKGTVKDTRPLTDKAYQKRKLTELAEFLEENGFKPSFTPAKLMTLSKKEFENIFKFLINIWEPSFEVKNFEEDAIRMLKNLGYPFIPNKSAFTYVARANFASLLGVLIYLLDLAKIVSNTDLEPLYKTGDSENPDEHAVLMNYILQCQQSGVEDESEMKEVFEKIVRGRNTEDYSSLNQEMESNRQKLDRVKLELAEIERLTNECEFYDTRIKRYEDYFQEMEKRKDCKEVAISNLENELQIKKSLLEELNQQLSKRQAIYDAQGFDGKRQLSHYEEQKKELNKALEKEKTKLKEIQEECWDMELNYSRLLDKGANSCKEFNQTNAQIEDSLKAVLETLQSINDNKVQRIIDNLRFELPEFPQQFNRSNLSSWCNEGALDELQKKISDSNVFIRALISTSSEELTEIEMKKVQLSAKLKCASSVELQKEQDLCKLEKQAIDEVKALAKKCDDDLKQLDDLRKVTREKEEEYNKLKSDLLEVEKIKLSKMEMLDKYLEEQKKFFVQCASNIEMVSKKSEACGDEIATGLEELLKKKQRE